MKNKDKLTGAEVNKIIKESTTLRKKMADLEERFVRLAATDKETNGVDRKGEIPISVAH